jgi:hypothetical protein
MWQQYSEVRSQKEEIHQQKQELQDKVEQFQQGTESSLAQLEQNEDRPKKRGCFNKAIRILVLLLSLPGLLFSVAAMGAAFLNDSSGATGVVIGVCEFGILVGTISTIKLLFFTN